MSSTGKRSAGKLARCVWTGGKAVKPYLSVLSSFLGHLGNRSANSTAKRLRAGFQSRMGIVHFFEMVRMAS